MSNPFHARRRESLDRVTGNRIRLHRLVQYESSCDRHDAFDYHYQTTIWMVLPGPRPRVTDFIDLTGVAESFRFLIGEAMWRHGLSASKCFWGHAALSSTGSLKSPSTDDLISFGLEQDLSARWTR